MYVLCLVSNVWVFYLVKSRWNEKYGILMCVCICIIEEKNNGWIEYKEVKRSVFFLLVVLINLVFWILFIVFF